MSYLVEYQKEIRAKKAAAEAEFPELLENLRAAGLTGEIVITFYGGGDEGSIEEITGTTAAMQNDVEEWAYKLLEGTGVDWYNNDGGSGEITIDLGAGTVAYVVNQNETVSREAASGSF